MPFAFHLKNCQHRTRVLELAALCCVGSGMGSGCHRSGAVAPAPTAMGDDHRADEAQLARLFPGAKLKEVALPVSANSLRRLSARSGLKFSGAEGEWEAFEAIRGGHRVGLALLSHADLASNLEIHLGFAVDPRLRVLQTVGMERTNAGFKAFGRQFGGKDLRSPFQLGRDLKAVADYPPQFSQTLADTVHKGLFLLAAVSKPSGVTKP